MILPVLGVTPSLILASPHPPAKSPRQASQLLAGVFAFVVLREEASLFGRARDVFANAGSHMISGLCAVKRVTLTIDGVVGLHTEDFVGRFEADDRHQLTLRVV